ncbi:Mom family adenine methylcarbamoylation protein [Agromyces humi]|uniref:Mom family adenine methylcarbamoylation protein n=1 Tax=Agromyces humi TaxID=1766800 RepID=UPI0013580004|nr:hypothetical protein [Agromyces humi]
MTQTLTEITPVSNSCQRWNDRKHSWRHPSEGGFDARRFEAVPLSEAVAKAFTVRNHYSGSFPAARFAYGLTTDDERLGTDGTLVDGRHLVGVAVLSVPMSSAALSNVFPDLEPIQQTIELGRFVLTDSAPANAESWFLGHLFQMAADDGIRGVVAFADPIPRRRTTLTIDEDGNLGEEVEEVLPGHVGLIYQASNGRALGRSTPRTLNYVPRVGKVLSERTLSKVRTGDRGAEAGEKQLIALGARARLAGENPKTWLARALHDIGATKLRHPGNHRYAWALGTPAQRRHTRFGLEQTAYPKPRDLLTVA